MGLLDTFKKMFGKTKHMGSHLSDEIAEKTDDILEAAKEMGQNIKEEGIAMAKNLDLEDKLEAAKKAGSTAIDKAAEMGQSILDETKKIVDNFDTDEAIAKAKSVGKNVVDKLEDSFEDLSEKIVETGESLVDKAKNMVENITPGEEEE